MIGDGKLVVDLYQGPIPRTGDPRPLEEWRFDPATLKGLAKRDFLGWGYTVPLPWGTYRPDLTCVQMKVRYEPAKGTPLYAEGAPMAVKNADKDGIPVVTTSAKPHVSNATRPQRSGPSALEPRESDRRSGTRSLTLPARDTAVLRRIPSQTDRRSLVPVAGGVVAGRVVPWARCISQPRRWW